MAYQYPDKDDALTAQMINSEYDAAYWEKSEEAVLQKAIDALNALHAKHDSKSLLDLGCGKGRLIKTFSHHVDKIVAIEPDKSRFQEADLLVDRLLEESDTDISVINGTIDDLDQKTSFDVILSSHVLQHLPCHAATNLLKSMSSHLNEDGLLILTTTYNHSDKDVFCKEEWRKGKRITTEISVDEFDRLFGTEDILPVRMFAKESMEHMALSAGLSLQAMHRYHFKGHSDPSQDEVADGSCARDVMYIFKKERILIDANLNYHFSFSIFDKKTGLHTDSNEDLAYSIKKAFPGALFYDENNLDETEQLFRDMTTGRKFLHGKGLPFKAFRFLLKDYSLTKEGFDIFDSYVLLTIYPETDVAQINISLSIRNATADELVYLKHLHSNGAPLINFDGRRVSINDIYKEVTDALNRMILDKDKTYLLELKRFGNMENVDVIFDKHSQLLYGILTGDEGWRHYPKELSKERLANQWGSREFIRLISFGSGNIFFNLSKSIPARTYTENRRAFDAQFYGDINPYFLIDSNFSGLTHGVFFSLELVMVVKTICNRILRRQAAFYSKDNSNVGRDIKETKRYRGELLVTLNKAEDLSRAEIGEMEKVLLVSQQIDPIIEKLKDLLELVESELDLLYQTSTNKLVNRLTILGLIISGIGVFATVASIL